MLSFKNEHHQGLAFVEPVLQSGTVSKLYTGFILFILPGSIVTIKGRSTNCTTSFHRKWWVKGHLLVPWLMSDGEGQAKSCVLIDGTAAVFTAHPTDGGKPYWGISFKCQFPGHTHRYLIIYVLWCSAQFYFNGLMYLIFSAEEQ